MLATCETKPMNAQAVQDRLHTSLRQWWQGSAQELFSPLDGELVYGTGYNTWGVQTQQKAIAAVAYLAEQGDEEALQQCIAMLRFNLRSHIDGPHACIDGQEWGHTWISVLGIERMMFVVEMLRDAGTLPQDIEDELRLILISEADWLLQEYEIVAGLVDNNKPESNIWNGAILHRATLLYPDAPHADAYREKGDLFLYNGISIESDLDVASPFRKDVVGANFFESMALNHHHYLNVGYMVICLSNIAMLHFSCKRLGQTSPTSLYHHADKLWSLIKMLSFDDGRLWRVGGDTRVRYCYCQDYALPMWLFIEDYFGEDCGHYIEGWVDQAVHEQTHNGDGLYLSERLSTMRYESPLYYTRLETDRACTLAMTATWLPLVNRDALTAAPNQRQAWSDTYHGAVVHRSEKRFASWVWDGGQGPTGMCVPAAASDMAEWGTHLFPAITACGDRNGFHHQDVVLSEFAGGFATSARVQVTNYGSIFEGGAVGHHLAEVRQCFIALPDDESCLCLQYVVAAETHFIKEFRGLQFKLPNDVWNNFKRSVKMDGEELLISGNDGQAVDYQQHARRIEIDACLAIEQIYQQSALCADQCISLSHADKRRTGLRHLGHAQVQRAGGFLYTEDFCAPLVQYPNNKRIQAGTVLLDAGFLITCNPERSYDIHKINAASGQHHLHIANGERTFSVSINLSDTAMPLNDVPDSICQRGLEGRQLAPLGYVIS